MFQPYIAANPKLRRVLSAAWLITMIILFILEWALIALAPTIHRRIDPVTEVRATIIDKPSHFKTDEFDHYVAYEYNGGQYESGWDCSCDIIDCVSLVTGEIVTVKIYQNNPAKTFHSYGDFRYNIPPLFRIATLIVSIIVAYLCTGTKFKRLRRSVQLDLQWIRSYIIHRELRHILMLSTCLTMLYLIGGYSFEMFFLVFGLYLIFRSLFRIFRILFKPDALTGYVHPCEGKCSREEGRDLDSTTLYHYIDTGLETLHYVGYVGRAAFFCANLYEGDNLLVVRWNSMDPYLVFKLADPGAYPLGIPKLPRRWHFPRNLLTLAGLVLISVLLSYINITDYLPKKPCEHEYHSIILYQPTVSDIGEEQWRCANCLHSEKKDIPKLKNILDARVVEKKRLEYDMPVPHFGGIEYKIEVKNTGDVPVHKISLDATIYTLGGEQIGFLSTSREDVVLQPNQVHSFSTVEFSYADSYTSSLPFVEETKNDIERIIRTDLNQLNFDFTVQYSVYDGEKNKSP